MMIRLVGPMDVEDLVEYILIGNLMPHEGRNLEDLQEKLIYY